MGFTELIKEAVSIPAAGIHPVSQAAGSVNTGNVDMSKFNRAMFELRVGSVGAAGTVDAKLQEAGDDLVFTDIASSSITQITASDKVATLELDYARLGANKRYVRMLVTVAVNNVLISATAFGFVPRIVPATGEDNAVVTQRLAVGF